MDSTSHRVRLPVRIRPSRGESGAGLLEVLIATLIVAIVAVGTVEFFARGRAAFDQEEHKRAATLLAQETLERAVATEYALIVNSGSERTVGNVAFTIETTVETNVPEDDLKSIRTTVTWEARPGIERNVTLATLVYNN